MKATELRIGNWIGHTTGMFKVASDEFALIERDEEKYFPIPLNGEWLLKFGFEKNPIPDRWFRFDMGGLELVRYKSPHYLVETIRNDKITSVQYVHQLQNLYFALTGNELKIKN